MFRKHVILYPVVFFIGLAFASCTDPENVTPVPGPTITVTPNPPTVTPKPPSPTVTIKPPSPSATIPAIAPSSVNEDDAPDSVYFTVTPGSYCDTRGTKGQSESGRTYTCKGPGDLRWRK